MQFKVFGDAFWFLKHLSIDSLFDPQRTQFSVVFL